MTNNPTRRRCQAIWNDVAFAPLTGWVNVWEDDTTGVWVEPCPGLITQESTSQIVSWDDLSATPPVRRSKKVESDRDTRTVFTTIDGTEVVAIDYSCLGYLFSAPADHPTVAQAIARSVFDGAAATEGTVP